MDVREPYTAPAISDLGSLIELTQGGIDKNTTSGDTINGVPTPSGLLS